MGRKELSEFDIHYQPHPSIKVQALANFLVECIIPSEVETGSETVELKPELTSEPWTIHIDGLLILEGLGLG